MAGAQASHEHVASFTLKVGGSELAPEWANQLVDIRVRNTLALPDVAVARFFVPRGASGGSPVDSAPFKIGDTFEVSLGQREARQPSALFWGEIAGLEPEFNEDGLAFVVRAYDRAHRLTRGRKSRVWNDVKPEDVVNKIAQEHGMQADVSSTTVAPAYIKQSEETDWELAWRLARGVDFEVVAENRKLLFRPAGSGDAAGEPLKWGVNLRSFKPRVSAGSQVEKVEVSGWDPATKATITAQSDVASATRTARPQITPDQAGVPSLANGRTLHRGDLGVLSAQEAQALADSAARRIADTWLEAEGACQGHPNIRAGRRIRVEEVGKYSGEYLISGSEQILRTSGFETKFTISSRSARTLLDLVQPTKSASFGSMLVVGLVSNNSDPDGFGRVRVEFPTLGRNVESAWARVACVGAGDDRGVFMLPQPEDEVVVGFEHGDPRRPYILGCVFSGGKSLPDPDLIEGQKNNLAVKTPNKLLVSTKEDTAFTVVEGDYKETTDKGSIIESSKKDVLTTAQGDVKIETKGGAVEITSARSVTIKANAGITIETPQSLSLKGMSVSVEANTTLTLRGTQSVSVQGTQIMLG